MGAEQLGKTHLKQLTPLNGVFFPGVNKCTILLGMGVNDEDDLRPWVGKQELLGSVGVVSCFEVCVIDFMWIFCGNAVERPLNEHDLPEHGSVSWARLGG